MKKYIITSILALGLLLISTTNLWAQPGFDDDVTDTPIDGGVVLLAAAGAAYGFKKLSKSRFQLPG